MTPEERWAETLRIWAEDGDPQDEVGQTLRTQTLLVRALRRRVPPEQARTMEAGAAYVVGMVSAVIAKTMYDLATEIDTMDLTAEEKYARLEFATTLATGVMIGVDSAQRLVKEEDPLGDGSMAQDWMHAVKSRHEAADAGS